MAGGVSNFPLVPGGISKYPSFSNFPASAGNGVLALALDTDVLYAYNTGSASWVIIGGPGAALSVGTIDSVGASNNGAVISSDALIMQSASGTKPGLVNLTTQTFAGAKTFSTSVASPSVLLNGSVSGALTHNVPSAVTNYALTWPAAQAGGATFLKNDGSGGLSWASGTGASGVDSIGTIDLQAKSADALVISGTTLYAQTADATNPGMVSNAAQTFSGAKTFSAAPILSSLTISLPLQLDGSKNIVSTAIDLSGSQATGILAAGRFPALTGDITTASGALATTLATVNSNVGSFTNAAITVNGKGLVTAASSGVTGNLTDVGTDGITIGSGTGAVLGSGTTISQHVADTTHNGYLNSTDWNTFNGKQASGSYITALTGDVTASGPGSVASAAAATQNNITSIPNLATVGTVTSGTWNATTLAINHGGTGQTTATNAFNALAPATAKGGIIAGTGVNTYGNLAVGTNGFAVVADSAQATGLNYASVLTNPMDTAGQMIYGGAAGVATKIAVGTSGQVPISAGATVAFGTLPGNSTALKAPTIQSLTSTGTQTGWLFTISTSSTVAVGDTYTNNSNTYTVQYALTGQSGQVLFMSGTGATSGTTLTRSAGVGTASITFSAKVATATYTTPTSPGPLYLKIKMAAGGGGGAGSGTVGGSAATAGGPAYFGGLMLQATGGGLATYASSGGDGGAGVIVSPAIGVAGSGAGGGQANGQVTSNGVLGGAPGGSSIFGGGAKGVIYSSAGAGAATNSGGGGSGGGSNNVVNSAAGGGGGAGGWVDAVVASPSATYPYLVGTAGSAGGAGTSGLAGGAGAAGQIIIEEHYQ